jgi:hypothetical protein
MRAKFTQDYANNWHKGDNVPIKPVDNGFYLVDNVAAIEKNVLIKVADIYDDDNKLISNGVELKDDPETIKMQLKRILYLEKELNDRIHGYITDYCLRGKPINPQELKDSLSYVIEDNIYCLEQNR